MKIIKHYELKIDFDSINYRTIKFYIPENFTFLDVRLTSLRNLRLSIIVDENDLDCQEFELYLLITNNYVSNDIEYIKTVSFFEYIYHVFRKRNTKLHLEPSPA